MPNFPPGIMQGDLRFTHTYYNMSHTEDARGPWNKGQGPWEEGEQWEYVDDPVNQVKETAGQREKMIEGHERDEKATKKFEKKLAAQRSGEVTAADPDAEISWEAFGEIPE
jgi:Mn-containing catalase